MNASPYRAEDAAEACELSGTRMRPVSLARAIRLRIATAIVLGALACGWQTLAWGASTNCAALSFSAVDSETKAPVLASVLAIQQEGLATNSFGASFFGLGKLWLPTPGAYRLLGLSAGYLDTATSVTVTNCGENVRVVLEFHRAEAHLDLAIRDIRTGIPIEGVEVALTFHGKKPPLAPEGTVSLTTDGRGRVRGVLDAGYYSFALQRSGFDDLVNAEPIELVGAYYGEAAMVSKLYSLDLNVHGYDPAAAPNPDECTGQGGADNQPIEGAIVELEVWSFRRDAQGAPLTLPDNLAISAIAELSNDAGVARLVDLPPGLWRITTKKIGYEATTEDKLVWPAPGAPFAAQQAHAASLPLHNTELAVRVSSAQYAQPDLLLGALVRLDQVTTLDEAQRNRMIHRCAKAAVEGQEAVARFPKLLPGTYQLSISHEQQLPVPEHTLLVFEPGIGIKFFPIEQTVSIGDGHITEEAFVLQARPARVHLRVLEETASSRPLFPSSDFRYAPSPNQFVELKQWVEWLLLAPQFENATGQTDRDGRLYLEVLPGAYGARLPFEHDFTGYGAKMNGFFRPWPYYAATTNTPPGLPPGAPPLMAAPLLLSSDAEYSLELALNGKWIDLYAQINPDFANDPIRHRVFTRFLSRFEPDFLNQCTVRLVPVGPPPNQLTSAPPTFTYEFALTNGDESSYQVFVPRVPPGRYQLSGSHPRNTFTTLELAVPAYPDPGMGPNFQPSDPVPGTAYNLPPPLQATYATPGDLPKFQYIQQIYQTDDQGNPVPVNTGPFDEPAQYVQPAWTSKRYIVGSLKAPADGAATYWTVHLFGAGTQGPHVHRGAASPGGIIATYTSSPEGVHTDALPLSDLFQPVPVKGQIFLLADVGNTNRAELRRPDFGGGPVSDHVKFITTPESAAAGLTYDSATGRYSLPPLDSFIFADIVHPLYVPAGSFDQGYDDGQAAYLLDIAARIGMNVTGQISDPDGRPLEGVGITLRSGSNASLERLVFTDLAGAVIPLPSAFDSQPVIIEYQLPGYKPKRARIDPVLHASLITETNIDLGGGSPVKQQRLDLSTSLAPLDQPQVTTFTIDRGGLVMRGLTYKALGKAFLQSAGPDPVTAMVTASASLFTASYPSLPAVPPQESLDTSLDDIVAAYFVDERYLSLLIRLLDPNSGQLYSDWSQRRLNQATNLADLPTGTQLQPLVEALTSQAPLAQRSRQTIFAAVLQAAPPPLPCAYEPNAQTLPPAAWPATISQPTSVPAGSSNWIQTLSAQIALPDLCAGALELAVLSRTRHGQVSIRLQGDGSPPPPPVTVVRPSKLVQTLFDIGMYVPVTGDKLWESAQAKFEEKAKEAITAAQEKQAAERAVTEQSARVWDQSVQQVDAEDMYREARQQSQALETELQVLRHRFNRKQSALQAEEQRLRSASEEERTKALERLYGDAELAGQNTQRGEARLALDRARNAYNSALRQERASTSTRDTLQRKSAQLAAQIQGVQNRLERLSPEERLLRDALNEKVSGNKEAAQRLTSLRQRYAQKDAALREKLARLTSLADKAPVFKLQPRIDLVVQQVNTPKYVIESELGISYGMANSEPNTQKASLGFIGSTVRAQLNYEAGTEFDQAGQATGKQALSTAGTFDLAFHRARNEAGAPGFWQISSGDVKITPSLAASLQAADQETFDFNPPYEAPTELKVSLQTEIGGNLAIRFNLLGISAKAVPLGPALDFLLELILGDIVHADLKATPGIKGSLNSSLTWGFPKAPPAGGTVVERTNHRQGFGIAGYFPTDKPSDPQAESVFKLQPGINPLSLELKVGPAEGEAGINASGAASISIVPPGPWKFGGKLNAFARFAVDLWLAKWEKQLVTSDLVIGEDTGTVGYLTLSRVEQFTSHSGEVGRTLAERWGGGTNQTVVASASGRAALAATSGALALVDAVPGASLPGASRVFVSRPSGASFALPSEVPGSEGAFHVATAQAANGDLIIVWAAIDEAASTDFPRATLRYAVYSARTDLSAPAQSGVLASGNHLYHSPQLTGGSPVDCYFLDSTLGVPGSDWNELHTATFDGDAWTTPQRLLEARSIVDFASARTQNSDRLLAVLPSDGALLYAVKPAGANWTDLQPVPHTAPGNDEDWRAGHAVSIAPLSQGRIGLAYVAASTLSNRSALFLTPYDFTAGWGNPMPVAAVGDMTADILAQPLADPPIEATVLAWTAPGRQSSQGLWYAAVNSAGEALSEASELTADREDRFRALTLLTAPPEPAARLVAHGTAARGGTNMVATFEIQVPHLSVAHVQWTQGALRFSILGFPERACILERSADLRSWAPVATNILAGGKADFTIAPDLSPDGFQFYRGVLGGR